MKNNSGKCPFVLENQKLKKEIKKLRDEIDELKDKVRELIIGKDKNESGAKG